MESMKVLKMKLDTALVRADALHSQLRLVLDDKVLTDREKIETIDGLLRAEDGK